MFRSETLKNNKCMYFLFELENQCRNLLNVFTIISVLIGVMEIVRQIHWLHSGIY